MPSTQNGFNKEKAIFWLCLGTLGGVAAYFVFSRPTDFPDVKPVTTQPLPKEVKFTEQVLKPIDAYLAGDCNAFAPVQTRVQTPKPPDVAQVKPTPPPPKEPEKPQPVKKPDVPPAKDLSVAFMGVVQMDGKTFGLLRCKDGSPAKRVQEGDRLEPYNYTITRIEPTAIFLNDEEGRPYVLRDGFLDVASAATTGNPNAVKAPAPAPTPGPSQKNPSPNGQQPVPPANTQPAPPNKPMPLGVRPEGGTPKPKKNENKRTRANTNNGEGAAPAQ
jgi:hypothetical protein